VGTPRKIPIRDCFPGTYCHFSLKDQLEKIAKDSNNNFNLFKLQISVDGIPLSRSSSKQFWPILGCVVNIKNSKPFAIGVYFGDEEPSSSSLFLKQFVEEASEVINKNILGLNNNIIKVEISAFVCDAPARAFVSNIKGHSGYFGCGKCIIEGDYVQNRVTFPDLNCQLRTNESFRTKRQEEHHLTEESELLKLPFDIVDGVPYEYMHLICLGVTRKLINLWLKGKLSKFRLSATKVTQFSKNLVWLKPQTSSDFSRKPRSLIQLKSWKATEFRLFLLYN
jgi:hypothetical protein